MKKKSSRQRRGTPTAAARGFEWSVEFVCWAASNLLAGPPNVHTTWAGINKLENGAAESVGSAGAGVGGRLPSDWSAATIHAPSRLQPVPTASRQTPIIFGPSGGNDGLPWPLGLWSVFQSFEIFLSFFPSEVPGKEKKQGYGTMASFDLLHFF